MARTRIRRLHILGYPQLQDVVLDLTHPTTGEALDRVCLIGRNGTGKSTILRLLDEGLAPEPVEPPPGARTALVLEHAGRTILALAGMGGVRFANVEPDTDVGALLREGRVPRALAFEPGPEQLRSFLPDLQVTSPSETAIDQGPGLDGVPDTSLGAALLLGQGLPVRHAIGADRLDEMWRLLLFHGHARERQRQAFEMLPENLQKTKLQLIREFEAVSPPVLNGLAALWNRILAPADLALDVDGARLPVLPSENLEAYVVRRSDGARVPYARLGTGVRNFLFRLGHLYLLYFDRAIERGFVFVDEPERSLFPDFLFELVSVYENVLRGPYGLTRTQLFVATHAPIVAAQFEPYERVVLTWKPDGTVAAIRGTAPCGDDPNDLLRKDFGLKEVLGPEGRRQREKYRLILQELERVSDESRPGLMAEAAEIDARYGFSSEP